MCVCLFFFVSLGALGCCSYDSRPKSQGTSRCMWQQPLVTLIKCLQLSLLSHWGRLYHMTSYAQWGWVKVFLVFVHIHRHGDNLKTEAWHAAIHVTAKSQTQLSNWTELIIGRKFVFNFQNVLLKEETSSLKEIEGRNTPTMNASTRSLFLMKNKFNGNRWTVKTNGENMYS